jgi:hypothetical protein
MKHRDFVVESIIIVIARSLGDRTLRIPDQVSLMKRLQAMSCRSLN